MVALTLLFRYGTIINRRLIIEKEQSQNIEDLKRKIVVQIGDLSRLLGMIPSDDVTVRDAGMLTIPDGTTQI